MNPMRNRIDLAEVYGGGIVMTTLILLLGYQTPSVLKWLARRLSQFASH